MTTYNRGPTPGTPAQLPPFLKKELEKIQRAFATISTTWAALTGKPANVTALGALVGAADKVPYFTGLGAMALADLTPYARTILACANAAATRTALGLGSMALLNTITEADITLADNTTNNVSAAKHGFAPKLPNNAAVFLDGTGAYSAPAGAPSYPPTLPTFPTIASATLAGRFSAEPSVSTLTLNTDGRVAQINDAAGGWGSNFTATTTARPRWLKRAMNGMRPGMVFDGVVAKLVAGGTKTIAQPLTVVFVVQNWKGGAANGNLFRDSAGGPVIFNTGGTQWSIFAGSTLSSAALFNQNTEQIPDGMTAAPTIIIAVFNGASSLIANNGVEVTGAAGATGISGTMRIGGDSTTSFAKMVFYEALFFSGAVNLSDRGLLNTYYSTALDINL